KRRQIVSETIMHYSLIAFAPHLRCLDPLGPMRWTIFLVKKFAFDAVRIPFHGKWTISQVGQEDRRDTDVVVNHLPFRESDLGIKHLVEIRNLNLTVFDD